MKNYIVVNGYLFNESLVEQKEIIRSAFGAEPELVEYPGAFGWERIAPYTHRWGFEYHDGTKLVVTGIFLFPENRWQIENVLVDKEGHETEMPHRKVEID